MTVRKSVALFPGQGAYFAGALVAVQDYPEIQDILREIDEVAQRLAGETVSELLFSADAPAIDELLESNPDLLQLAIYSTSVVAHRVLLSRGLHPDVLAGHSFGEIAALVCAGAFSVGTGAEIVWHRSAALRAAGELDGYLLAVSTDVGRSEQILRLVGDPEAVVAVENHEGQTVLAGPRASIDTAGAVASALGIGAVSLKAPYPFHSPLLRDAAFDFAARTRHIPQRRIEVEVYSPILGRAYRDTDKLTAVLAGHLTRRVSFASALRALQRGGANTFVECGSLDTLSKIARHVLGDGPEIIPLLLPGSTLPEALATQGNAGAAVVRPRDALRSALAPRLSAGEFERLWKTCVEHIVQFTMSEFAPAAPPVDEAPPVRIETLPAPVPEPALPAVPVETPVLAGVPQRDQLFQELVFIYADALEYPPEVFDEDTDLEAELGVDSVKQTELLRRIGETYRLGPLPTDFKIGEHNTLGRIADMITAA